MGNTPSQGPFHYPEEENKEQPQSSQITRSNDESDSHMSVNPGNKLTDIPRGKFLIGRPVNQLKDHSPHQKANSSNPISTCSASSLALQIGYDSINDQPYSMDSLTIDTLSSMSANDLSPSSTDTQSLEPLGYLTVSNENCHLSNPKQMKFFSHGNSKELSGISTSLVEFDIDMPNQFDSLEHLNLNVDTFSQNGLTSLSCDSLQAGEDTVTVNGLNVPQDSTRNNTHLEGYQKLQNDVEKGLTSVEDHVTSINESGVDLFRKDTQDMKSRKDTGTCSTELEESSHETNTTEKFLSENKGLNKDHNRTYLMARSTLIGNSQVQSVQPTDDNSQINSVRTISNGIPVDAISIQPDFISNNVSVVQVCGEATVNCLKELTESGNNEGANGWEGNTDAPLAGNSVINEDIKLQEDFLIESKDGKLGPVDFEIESLSGASTQRNENKFNEMVVISNLIFVEGPNNENGQVVTQVCLQSSERQDTDIQHSRACSENNNISMKRTNNPKDRVFKTQSFPNYNIENVGKNTNYELLQKDWDKKSEFVQMAEESTILSLVLSSGRPQFPEQRKSNTNAVQVSQEIYESWDDIEHNSIKGKDEDKETALDKAKFKDNPKAMSVVVCASEYPQGNEMTFNRSTHRESLVDFEQLEAEISRIECTKNTSEAKIAKPEPEYKYSCTDDLKIQNRQAPKEELDYEEIRKNMKEDVHHLCDEYTLLGGNYYKSQDREIGEESINFHKEASITSVIETTTAEILGTNVGRGNYSGMATKTIQAIDGDDTTDSKYGPKDIIMLNQSTEPSTSQGTKIFKSSVQINERKDLLPKADNEGPELANANDKVGPHLPLPSCISTNNPHFDIIEDLQKSTTWQDNEKVQHVSKVYVSSESEPMRETKTYPVSVDHTSFSDQQKSSPAEPEEFRKRNRQHSDTVKNQEDFFVEIDVSQNSKPNSVKKISKPSSSSCLRKSSVKFKELYIDENFSSTEISNSLSPLTSDPEIEIVNSKIGPSRGNVSSLEGLSRETVLALPELTDSPSSPVSSNASDNMDPSRIQKNLDSGMESSRSSRSTSANELHNIYSLYEWSWPSSCLSDDNVNETVSKRQLSSKFLAGQNFGNHSGSISSANSSKDFLPQIHSTPVTLNATPNTTGSGAILRNGQNLKFDENGNHPQSLGPRKRINNILKPIDPSRPFQIRDDNLMSSGVGVGLEKDRNYTFSDSLLEKINTFDHRSSMPEGQDEGGLREKNLLTGGRGNIMSPSLSNEFMVMNGVTEGHTDTDAISINPVEEALAVQEEHFSRTLQEKENFINELQNNLESLKSKSKSDTDYTRVLGEYEKTMSTYIQKIDEVNQKLQDAEGEKVGLIKERDQALEDLRNVESAFSDVHRKYERAKGLLENLKINEEILVRRDQELVQKLQNRDMKIQALKEKAQDSLEQMHVDYENRMKDIESENIKLRAQYRMMEMKLESAERDVEQKAKENAQLSALCDELIHGQVIN